MTTLDTCSHCNLPILPANRVVDEIDGKRVHFCCRGCQGVYRIISGSGMTRFYERRDWPEQGVPAGVYETEFDEALLADHVTTHSETSAEISLIIEGIRCASCVWLLEKLLAGEQGVETVRVNYGTHRAQIRFNPRETSPTKLFSSVSRLGYLPHAFTTGAAQKAAEREQRTLLIRFGTAAFLSMQLMGFSIALYGGYFHGIDPGVRQMIQYFAAAVTTPVVFYSGWPFLTGGWRSLRNHAPSMDLLITMGVLAAYSYSLYALVTGGEVYFDTAAMIITLILLGRLFEGSARNRSIAGIDKLLQLAPESANMVDGEHIHTVASAILSAGDRIMVRPGERIPVDCRIYDGESELDESAITGEPMPVVRRPGDSVSAGTLNISSSIRLTVERPATESFVARMARMVEDAQNRKAPIQSLADGIAALFVPVVTLAAASTWLFWYYRGGSPSEALLNAVAVLVVACPCALGLATPTAVLVASGNAAVRGILFRGGDVLEMAARIDIVAFDKTGTLTLGKPTVKQIIPAPGQSEEELLGLACRAENGSNHPIALSILTMARSMGIITESTGSVRTVPGRGLQVITTEGEILVGSRTFLSENSVEPPPVISGALTEVYVSLNGVWRGVLLIHDPIRGEAVRAISRLQQIGLQTVLLTGDHYEAAALVSSELAITNYLADQGPSDKVAWIDSRQKSGHKILMVGDGINDAPALSAADVGCTMAGGSDIALETSDLILTRPDLDLLCDAVIVARQALLVIKQNLAWAFAYNLVTIPLAASGNLAPIWAAFAMAVSSILVVGNSLRLGRMMHRIFPVAKQLTSN